jgi:hypothetical protein
VDECTHIAELQLDRRAHVVEAYDLSKLLDNSETAIDTAEVIVGQFENEQVLKDVFIDH